MKCPRCLNEDPTLFYKGSKGWYCRACIDFKRQLIEEEIQEFNSSPEEIKTELELNFELTPDQKKISHQLCDAVQENHVLLLAVCGAGKTEMLLEMIQDCFKRKKKVGIAIARRQVVLELSQRLQTYFPSIQVTPLCQGYTHVLQGDLIICTTHQLYRFYQTFDVLVIDEPDAFPFKGNAVLQGIARTSCRGHLVYLTATPDEKMMKAVERGEMVQLSLMKRPHGYPLPCPKVHCYPKGIGIFILLNELRRSQRQVLFFVPTIKMARRMSLFLGLFFKVNACSSKTKNKESVIQAFRKKEVKICVCTSILERGVTFNSIDVFVYEAHHSIFDEASLIQIAGRAGRKREDPYGNVQFYCCSKTEAIEQCCRRIQNANTSVSIL